MGAPAASGFARPSSAAPTRLPPAIGTLAEAGALEEAEGVATTLEKRRSPADSDGGFDDAFDPSPRASRSKAMPARPGIAPASLAWNAVEEEEGIRLQASPPPSPPSPTAAEGAGTGITNVDRLHGGRRTRPMNRTRTPPIATQPTAATATATASPPTAMPPIAPPPIATQPIAPRSVPPLPPLQGSLSSQQPSMADGGPRQLTSSTVSSSNLLSLNLPSSNLAGPSSGQGARSETAAERKLAKAKADAEARWNARPDVIAAKERERLAAERLAAELAAQAKAEAEAKAKAEAEALAKAEAEALAEAEAEAAARAKAKAAEDIEIVLKRNSHGRFGVSFGAPGDGTIRLETISDAHMIDDDDRMRLCVGDIVLSLNGTKLKNGFLAQQSERALQRMIEKSGEQMVLHVCRPSEMVYEGNNKAAAARAELDAMQAADAAKRVREALEEGDVIGAASIRSAEAARRTKLALDADGDGKVSAAELAAGTTRALFAGVRFFEKKATAVIDTDGDGKVSAAEMAAALTFAGVRKKAVAALDADGDGKVSAAEMAAGAAAAARKASMKLSKWQEEIRASLDTDGDGHVSAAELAEGIRRARIAFVKRVVVAMSLATVWVANLAAVVLMGFIALIATLVLTPNELWVALISWGFAVLWTIAVIEPIWILFWVTLTILFRWLLTLGFDTDGDGQISFKELRMGAKKAADAKAAAIKANMDTDGDGKLSAGEVAAAIGRSTRNMIGSVGSSVSRATSRRGRNK